MDLALTCVTFMSILMIVGMKCAYRNGAVDGYGYAKEPNNPGHREAGEHLKRTMVHRWPDLLD